MGYDATVDTDVRDRALDVLVPLLELDSPSMARRLGRVPDGSIRIRMYEALVPILTTAVGRSEASMLASHLFREISKSRENWVGLRYVQRRLMELAARDPRISHLMWNHLFTIPSDDPRGEDIALVLEEEGGAIQGRKV